MTIRTVAQQTSARHFYLPNEASWSKLKTLVQGTPCHEREDIIQHAWAALLRVYLPDHYDPALLRVDQCEAKKTTNYDVIVQSYHRMPISLDWRTKPSVVATRTIHAVHPDSQVMEMKRDIIWVECKASSGDQPGDWKEVMGDAVAKLHAAHPTGPLYLILNVGVEWLMFYWDPTNPAPAGQQLRMVDADGTTIWDVDPRVRPPPGINAYHVGPDNVVNTVLAKSLDCFSVTQVDEQPRLAYQNDLDVLEQCIDVMINHPGYLCRHSHQD